MSAREQKPAEVRDLAPRRREEQRLETRGRLYKAALEEFRRAGFADAQIERIARAAGVARGTFYFHFPTKEHVLVELVRRLETRTVERLRRQRRRARSVKTFLGQVVDAVLETWEDVGDAALMGDVLSLFVKPKIPMDYASDPLIELFVEYFAEAAEGGEVRDDITPYEMMMMFGSHLFVLMMSAGRPVAERRLMARKMIHVFIRGISP